MTRIKFSLQANNGQAVSLLRELNKSYYWCPHLF